MCGICGLYSPSLQPDLSTVLGCMNRALTHRGPDDYGQYQHGSCGIAMRRLSIIDVAGGHQPILNEDGQIVTVFNGEIYNYLPLREMLRERGHHFQTQSDTEVIVHLYEDEAEKTPEFLKGMFAFCIYDKADDSLFIARDRFGEKPLYYCHAPDGFVFSSEIKSLLECPYVPRRLDYEALGYYMRIGFVPAPLTMFEDVCILPPGHWLRWRNGELTVRPYYAIDYQPDPALDRETDAVEALQAALGLAVQRQSISDVPLGAFLSGGIDSSSVVAMLQATSNRTVKTFTMRFEDQSHDEGEIARQVAQHLGTEHHEFFVPNVAFEPDDLLRIIDHVGLPFNDTSAIPTYILSKHIRQEVTVALSGDGGDEMFAGYPIFRWGMTIRKMQRLPSPILRLGAGAAAWASRQTGMGRMSKLRRVRRGLEAASHSSRLLPLDIHAIFEPRELNTLLLCERTLAVATGELPRFTDLPPQAQQWSPLRQLMYYRLKHGLNDQMLTKVDRMSMAASLEVRAPLLDADVAQLSMRLPDKHLIRNGFGKHILRQAMQENLPEIVFSHPKSGFGVPMHSFQNEKYKAMAHELLDNRDSIMSLLCNRTVREIMRAGIEQKAERADRSIERTNYQLWALMQLSAWQQRFHVSI